MVKGAPRILLLAFVIGWPAMQGTTQTQQPANQPIATAEEPDPLPDIPTLMREVAAKQAAAEAIEKDYLYHSVVTEQNSDGHGGVKKTETQEYDNFWIDGIQVMKLTRKNGRDLTPEEQKKEGERVDKEIAKAKKRIADAQKQGKPTDPRGNEEITISRILALGTFSNPRRMKLNGRDTIVVDYTGDPKARTENRAENIFRDLVGTVWVDAQDRVMVKTEGHCVNTFKVGAGLLVNIQKGSSFSMTKTKVNNEVWLPQMVEGHGDARLFLLFNFKGSLRAEYSNYRKFRATSTVLPVMGIPSQ